MNIDAIDTAITKEFGPGMKRHVDPVAHKSWPPYGELTAYYTDGNQRLIVDVTGGTASVFTFHRNLKPC